MMTSLHHENAPTPPAARRSRVWIVAAVAVILSGAAVTGITAWALEDGRRNFAVVEPGKLYRSGQLSEAVIRQTLKDCKIGVVIDLTSESKPDSAQKAELAACKDLGVEHLRFPLRGDGTGKVENYVGAIEAIHRAMTQGKPVLVHCVAGAQRTGGVIAAYRILLENQTPQEAVAGMMQAGWETDDVALTNYLNKHLGEMADQLTQRGVLSHAPAQTPRIAPP